MSTVEFHPVELPAGRRRAARRVAHRPRPDARVPARPTVRRVAARRRTRCSTSSARSDGPRRRAARGCTSTCASSRPTASATCAGRRWPSPARSSAAPPTLVTTTWWRKDRDPARAVRRLQPERPRPHHGRRLLGAGRARGDGVDADHVGRDRRRRGRATSRWRTVPARFAELGDLHAGIDDAVFAIDELLEWADRDEARRCRRRRAIPTTGLRERRIAASRNSGCCRMPGDPRAASGGDGEAGGAGGDAPRLARAPARGARRRRSGRDRRCASSAAPGHAARPTRRPGGPTTNRPATCPAARGTGSLRPARRRAPPGSPLVTCSTSQCPLCSVAIAASKRVSPMSSSSGTALSAPAVAFTSTSSASKASPLSRPSLRLTRSMAWMPLVPS